MKFLWIIKTIDDNFLEYIEVLLQLYNKDNPQPSNCEPSTLLLDHSFCFSN